MTKFKPRVLVLNLIAAISAFAHYTWVSPSQPPLVAGKTAVVQISHGHKFPQSEEAINASQVELFVLAPSGARTKLDAAPTKGAVTANYAVKETGLHRIVMLQDRGVTSRTPKGVQAGGRDKHPDATQSSRMLRSAIAYAQTSNSAIVNAKPAGLEFELVGAFSDGSWRLQLLKQGKPAQEVAIEVFLAGSDKPVSSGKTGADGRWLYKPSAGAKGPAMFSAEVKDPAPAGGAYDFVTYATSLYVNW